jgi:murein DD-endopeptidase MepM/ murein hydrolase activator NlpD
MSPSSSPVLQRRRSRGLPRPSRGRNRPPQRAAVSAVMTAIRSRLPAIGSALAVAAVWSIAAYFAFGSDVLTRLTARQTEMQITYEDHIAELRARVDRVVSGKFLDQKQVEQQLTALLQRQATLEQHTSALSGDLSTTGTIRPVRTSPINDTAIFMAPPDDDARLQSRELPASATRFAERATPGGLSDMLARMSVSLDKVEQKQIATLADLEERIDTRTRRIRSVLADLGIDSSRASPGGSVGGPFVPIKPPQSDASAFEHQLFRINAACTQIDRYTNTLVAAPVRKPVTGKMNMSSPFGIRLDPFLGRPAVHPGIDLRGEVGEPVRATATGHVTVAGRERGYGNAVEISHGNGFATRYGHLSVITVKVGQFVRIGEVVGKIGSTGRSTGPHLHYETRINGEAVDPQKFLRAGIRLGDV